MSEFTLPLKQVMLLQNVLDAGGTTHCLLSRPEITCPAVIHVENDSAAHHLNVQFGPCMASLTLNRNEPSKYMALRDFLQDVANGRTESGRLSQEELALRDALDSVNSVIAPDQVAYITTTTNPDLPVGAVVTNERGEICAAATGSCKDHLAQAVHAQLRPTREGIGERA